MVEYSFCNGKFSEFDLWRARHGLSDFDLSGLPSFSEIDGSQSSSGPISDTVSECKVPVFAEVDACLETPTTRGETCTPEKDGSVNGDASAGVGNVRGATRQSDLCYAVNRTPTSNVKWGVPRWHGKLFFRGERMEGLPEEFQRPVWKASGCRCSV